MPQRVYSKKQGYALHLSETDLRKLQDSLEVENDLSGEHDLFKKQLLDEIEREIGTCQCGYACCSECETERYHDSGCQYCDGAMGWNQE